VFLVRDDNDSNSDILCTGWLRLCTSQIQRKQFVVCWCNADDSRSTYNDLDSDVYELKGLYIAWSYSANYWEARKSAEFVLAVYINITNRELTEGRLIHLYI